MDVSNSSSNSPAHQPPPPRFGETLFEKLWFSTKSLSGHSLGAAGVQEAIYSLLMQQNGFIAASANIEDLDPEAEGMPIAVERHDGVDLQRVMSNSFGFGGTNASLVFQKYTG